MTAVAMPQLYAFALGCTPHSETAGSRHPQLGQCTRGEYTTLHVLIDHVTGILRHVFHRKLLLFQHLVVHFRHAVVHDRWELAGELLVRSVGDTKERKGTIRN
mmetsp:Transcript_13490/g.40943  ORF Transcript_13490/g.40943 Transcript_13490/m.40943 type:complete len:103 (-) Transcript_13490:1825-2133(-)